MPLCLFTYWWEKYLKFLILQSIHNPIIAFSNEHESRIWTSDPRTNHYTHIFIIFSPCDLGEHLWWSEQTSHNRRSDPRNEVEKSLESYDDGNGNYSWKWQKNPTFLSIDCNSQNKLELRYSDIFLLPSAFKAPAGNTISTKNSAWISNNRPFTAHSQACFRMNRLMSSSRDKDKSRYSRFPWFVYITHSRETYKIVNGRG